jgi:para-aminobenzoate synthetase
MPTPVAGCPISPDTIVKGMGLDMDTAAVSSFVASVPSTSHTPTTAAITTNPTLPPLRTLIVDNYDSYTFNLLQLFDEDQLKNVVVVRNDQFEW